MPCYVRSTGIIHRDYQLSNAPIKFYDYNGTRLEISNPGGLYGLAKPDNFPSVNDYRNPLLAGVMKVMGFVNQYNRGIAKVKQEMATNGNPPPTFDVNRLTEFRVTVLVSTKVPHIVPHEPEGGTSNGTINAAEPGNGMINGTINGTINDWVTLDIESKILAMVTSHPGIQRRELAEKLGISVRSLARVLQKMTSDPQDAQIEHRGSNKTGGWFHRT
jgi:ATP-dependent DNA helicase RecG